ncbi:MAG TPA: hypothetical protein VM925_35425, partial [Labilithrix sp.]|nr:hypothetical protein [Labilithrix sp.]
MTTIITFLVTSRALERHGGMLTLIRLGGTISMLFILAIGLIGLGSAFYFALRPSRRSLGFIWGMALATLFGTLAATAADVGATMSATARAFEGKSEESPAAPSRTEAEALPHAMHLLAEGLGESTSPCVLGFPILALTAMLVGVGRRRLDGRPDVV